MCPTAVGHEKDYGHVKAVLTVSDGQQRSSKRVSLARCKLSETRCTVCRCVGTTAKRSKSQWLGVKHSSTAKQERGYATGRKFFFPSSVPKLSYNERPLSTLCNTPLNCECPVDIYWGKKTKTPLFTFSKLTDGPPCQIFNGLKYMTKSWQPTHRAKLVERTTPNRGRGRSFLDNFSERSSVPPILLT